MTERDVTPKLVADVGSDNAENDINVMRISRYRYTATTCYKFFDLPFSIIFGSFSRILRTVRHSPEGSFLGPANLFEFTFDGLVARKRTERETLMRTLGKNRFIN